MARSRPGWGRSVSSGFSRAWSALADLTRPPPAGGGVTTTIATSPLAEADLMAMARSPNIFGAINARAMGLQSFPIRVSRGYGPGSPKEILDANRVPWVATLLTLLTRPDPADVDRVFPAHPGELLLGQLVADLLMTGNAYARIQTSGAAIVGLHRLHPQSLQLVRVAGEDRWRFTPATGIPEDYRRGDVAHLRLLSWERNGAGELGTGAAEPLRYLLEAEQAALRSTAVAVTQGGCDVQVTGKTDRMMAYLQKPEHRKQIADQVAEGLSGGTTGRRVYVIGGDLDISPTGLKPADIQAPETLAATKAAATVALGITPIALGDNASTFATAAIQQRVQYQLDANLALIFEVCILRPLAQYFCRHAGGHWGGRSAEISAWIDLSTHPGAQSVRTDAINRMAVLVGLGWTAEQAAESEGVDLPPPEGTPAPAPAPAPAPTSGRRPIGDAATAAAEPAATGRSWWASFAPRAASGSSEERTAAWNRIEDQRARHDRDLSTAAELALQADRERYLAAIVPALEAAQRRSERAPPAGEGGAVYDVAAVEQAIPPAAPDLYSTQLRLPWAAGWDAAAAVALEDVEGGAAVPPVTSTPEDLLPLDDAARSIATTSHEATVALVRRLTSDGLSVQRIAQELDTAEHWGVSRALLIGRTESVRIQTSGSQAQYRRAVALGLPLEQEWLAGTPSPSQRLEHALLDGKRAPIDGTWTFADGVVTSGPGLSGVPKHDCNCRCAERAIRAR